MGEKIFNQEISCFDLQYFFKIYKRLEKIIRIELIYIPVSYKSMEVMTDSNVYLSAQIF